MIHGLDLFSGYGGISLALAPWCRPILYCEIERYSRSVLLSRMASGDLPEAPIWDDVRTFGGRPWRGLVDIIYGGFPCQDISCAGAGRGLDGERSGLFFEIMRLVDEIKPAFVFLENVPAIRVRGLDRVLQELAGRGYDCRWRMLSAQEVGAPHRRNRWFLLAAYTERLKLWTQSGRSCRADGTEEAQSRVDGSEKSLADAAGTRLESSWRSRAEQSITQQSGWWASEPGISRVAYGTPYRVDRIRALGNGVVPAQVREAFLSLMGFDVPSDQKMS